MQETRRKPKGQELVERVGAFAIRTCRFVKALPGTEPERAIAAQLVRAATSTGANYRAARCARSGREFVARIGVALEEADESVYWLEVLARASPVHRPEAEAILQEARELRAIFATSMKTAKTTLARQHRSGSP
jgi:four helix bundle protein